MFFLIGRYVVSLVNWSTMIKIPVYPNAVDYSKSVTNSMISSPQGQDGGDSVMLNP